MKSGNNPLSITQFYNGNAWSFTSYDDDSITFGKRFIAGGFSQGSYFDKSKSVSSGLNNASKKQSISGSKSVIKITGHNNTASKLRAHVNYITRNGTIEMEDQEGEIHTGKIDKSISPWVTDHHDRLNNSESKSPRIASSMVISASPDSDPDVLQDSVREFASKAFSGHRYLMVLHAEETETNSGKITKHPHVHLVIERRSPNNERALQTNVKDLAYWRKEFSEIAKSRGLDLSYQRAEISKQPESATNRYVYAMLKKGQIPDSLKIKYQIARNRLKENRVFVSKGEQKIIDNEINSFLERQKEISDLNSLISVSKNDVMIKKYQNEKRYLEYINASQRMPVSTSQLMMKYAIHQRKSQSDPDYKFNTAVPTVKHYMYGMKLAKSHGVDLPPTANIDTKMLSRFIKEYADKPNEKFIGYIKDIAADRGLDIRPSILESQKSARNWLRNNINHATVKALDKAYKLSDDFNVDIPKKLDKTSISNFIDEYSKRPTDKMNKYAQMISEKTGLALNEELKTDKEKLSKWIEENRNKTKSRSNEMSILASFNPDEKNLKEIDSNIPNVKDEALIKVIKTGVNFPKEKLNDNEFKLNFLRAHAEFKDSDQWTRLHDKLVSQDKSVQKQTPKRDDFDRV